MARAKYDYSPERLLGVAPECDSFAGVAARLGMPANTLIKHLESRPELRGRVRNALKAPAEEQPPVRSSEWENVELGDVRRLLQTRDLDPADWLVTRARVNEWGAGTCSNCEAEVEPLSQLRVDLEPSASVVLPARVDGWKPPVKKPAKPSRDERLVVILSDQHAPNHDEDLHAAAVRWLAKHKPDAGVINGDLLDMDGGVSRHRHNPASYSSLQEGVDAAGRILRDYVAASPGTDWTMLAGNHEDRLRNAILDQLRGVTGLTRFDDDLPVLSVPFLLRLDELGVRYEGSVGEYAQHAVRVADNLTVRHGWLASKGSGATALKTLDVVRHHVAVGHTHRQGVVAHTHHTIDGDPVTLLACEVGTMAETKGGGGYAVLPDWQQGFATASVWPDGTVGFDLARWDGRSLLWRGERWTP